MSVIYIQRPQDPGVVSGYTNQINSLNQQRTNLQNQINSLQGQINDLNAKISGLQQDIAQKNATINSLNQQIAAQQALIAQLTAQRNALQEEKARLEGIVSQNQQEIQNLEKEISFLQAQLKEIDAYYKKLLSENQDTFFKEMNDLYTLRMQYLQEVRQREIEAVKEQDDEKIKKAQFEQLQIIVQLESIHKDYQDASTQLEELRTQATESLKMLKETTDKYQELTGELHDLTNTPAPTTPTPKPINWGTTMYVIIDAETWMNEGSIIVMALNGTELVTEPFMYRDLRQVFVISSDGHLRCMKGNGSYATSMENCTLPMATETAPEKNWIIRRIPGGYASEFSIMSETCGSFLTPSIGQVTLDKAPRERGWYVIPVGRFA